MIKSSQLVGKVGFAVGTGRCGTLFLHKALSMERNVAACHERNNLNETFHRYCQWNNLPVDHRGFLDTKQDEICEDLKKAAFSFEASAHLSLSIRELYERFQARFVLLVRRPEDVVKSYLVKGWYKTPIVRDDTSLAISYQPGTEYMHRFLGRIVPNGDEFDRWQNLSRVGQLAWYWNALNTRVVEQFNRIPETHWHICKLEDLDFARYAEILSFLGVESKLPQRKYDALARQRPNKGGKPRTNTTWTSSERLDFEAEVEPMSDYLQYYFNSSGIS